MRNNNKVGVLTFSKASNYGAVLQCYALCEVLKKQGFDPVLIEYELPSKNTGLRGLVRSELISVPFRVFRKNYLPVFGSISEVDFVVIGSDQVWNTQITGDKYLYFFGNFEEKKFVFYAASFGVENLNNTYDIAEVKSHLLKSQAISVREDRAQEILKDVFDLPSIKVLDPTLLLDNYTPMFGRRKKIKNKYAVIYLFNNSKERVDALRSFVIANCLDFYCLNSFRNGYGAKNLSLVSVGGWLEYISNSEFVITDSFHCVVFSIIFRRKFVALVANPTRISRIESLLSSLGLLHLLIYKEITAEELADIQNLEIDYDEVHLRLKELRSESIRFLLDSFAG